eukprot:CAMPEP_0197670952 /NCGR_PEP_ID=MMETSP1338-20131121/75699_1 /TAXON_ID=43686 ORGANISM="Pelagodinium beii, Strain RCC1491" /NCGR_SAMPLE_ID=MMETSP1338 /ASSEMBLY_ACC=CAM_ASM_000754 /LENGTH=652 /DNA_ID=CAMNT_0043250771 /DNA_START=96 /DNA_END=2054 /DNA_ORIENTATION=-
MQVPLLSCSILLLATQAAGQQLGSNWLAGDVTDKSPASDRHTYYVHDGLRISKREANSAETPLDAVPLGNLGSQGKCMEYCDEDPRCECLVYWTSQQTCQRWAGCRVNPSGFEVDPSANTLMKVPTLRPQYTEHDHFNTYSLTGSKDIDRGGHPALVASFQDCQDRCTVDDTCDCSVYATDGTYRCWKRQGCGAATLVYDPIFTVYVKVGGARVKAPTTTVQDLYGWTPPPATTESEAPTLPPTVTVTTTLLTTLPPTTPPTTRLVTTPPQTSQAVAVAMQSQATITITTITATTMTTTSLTTAPPPPGDVELLIQVLVPFPQDLLQVSSAIARRLRSEEAEAAESLQLELKDSRAESAMVGAISTAFSYAQDDVKLLSHEVARVNDDLEVSMSFKIEIPYYKTLSQAEEDFLQLSLPGSAQGSNFMTTLGQGFSSYPELERVKTVGDALLAGTARYDKVEAKEYTTPNQVAVMFSKLPALLANKNFIISMSVVLVLVLVFFLLRQFGRRGYQRLGGWQRSLGRSLAARLETRSARQIRVKRRVEKYAGRALDLLMAPEPEYDDSELLYLVRVLNRCRGHAKALCGSPWGPWQTSGDCQICKRRIDRAEKGLQCGSGGHRLCWPCMVSIMNWETLAVQEGDNAWTWATKEWL